MGPNTNSVSDLDSRDFGPHLRRNASNFVASDERQDSLAPTARDSMMIRSAHTAIFYSNVDIVVACGLGFEIDKFEIGIFLVVVDCIALYYNSDMHIIDTLVGQS